MTGSAGHCMTRVDKKDTFLLLPFSFQENYIAVTPYSNSNIGNTLCVQEANALTVDLEIMSTLDGTCYSGGIGNEFGIMQIMSGLNGKRLYGVMCVVDAKAVN